MKETPKKWLERELQREIKIPDGVKPSNFRIPVIVPWALTPTDIRSVNSITADKYKEYVKEVLYPIYKAHWVCPDCKGEGETLVQGGAYWPCMTCGEDL